MGQDEVDESGQVRGRPPPGELSLEQLTGQKPAVVVLHAGLGGGGDRLAPGDQTRRAILRATSFASDEAQARVQAKQMGLGFLDLARQSR